MKSKIEQIDEFNYIIYHYDDIILKNVKFFFNGNMYKEISYVRNKNYTIDFVSGNFTHYYEYLHGILCREGHSYQYINFDVYHCEDGPAFIEYDNNGNPVKKNYFIFGKQIPNNLIDDYPDILTNKHLQKILL